MMNYNNFGDPFIFLLCLVLISKSLLTHETSDSSDVVTAAADPESVHSDGRSKQIMTDSLVSESPE